MLARLKYLFLLVSYNCLSQGNHFPSGAGSQATGDANATISDVYSIVNNIAGIANSKSTLVAAAFENRYGLSALNSSMAILSIPIGKLNIGFQAAQYGDRYFNESTAGVGIAHSIGVIKLGVKINFIQIKSFEARTRIALTGEFGGIINLSKQIIFGAHIYNFNQAQLYTNGRQKSLPVILKSGIQYIPYKNIKILLEIFKDLSFPPSVKAGVEYLLGNRIYIRTGFSSNNKTIATGAGINIKSFNAGYALTHQLSLGFIQQLSLAFTIKN